MDHQGKPVEYIEVTLDDIDDGEPAGHRGAGPRLDDLPPQTRRLLDLIDGMVTQACQRQGLDRADFRFSRREVREATGWGNTQLKVHLKRLEELEYLLVHRGGRGQSIVYELLYEKPAATTAKSSWPASSTWTNYDATGRGQATRSRSKVGLKSASNRGQVGPPEMTKTLQIT